MEANTEDKCFNPYRPSHVWKNIQTMRENNLFCDVCLTAVNGSQFMAHSVILSSASPVLFSQINTLFRSETARPVMLPLTNIEPHIIPILLDYLYGFENTFDKVNHFQILDAFSKLQIDIQMNKPKPTTKDVELSVTKTNSNRNSSLDSLSRCPFFNSQKNKDPLTIPLKKRLLLSVIDQLTTDKDTSTDPSLPSEPTTGFSLQTNQPHRQLNRHGNCSTSTQDNVQLSQRSAQLDTFSEGSSDSLVGSDSFDDGLLDIGPTFVNDAKQFIPHPVADMATADPVKCPHLRSLVDNDMQESMSTLPSSSVVNNGQHSWCDSPPVAMQSVPVSMCPNENTLTVNAPLSSCPRKSKQHFVTNMI